MAGCLSPFSPWTTMLPPLKYLNVLWTIFLESELQIERVEHGLSFLGSRALSGRKSPEPVSHFPYFHFSLTSVSSALTSQFPNCLMPSPSSHPHRADCVASLPGFKSSSITCYLNENWLALMSVCALASLGVKYEWFWYLTHRVTEKHLENIYFILHRYEAG